MRRVCTIFTLMALLLGCLVSCGSSDSSAQVQPSQVTKERLVSTDMSLSTNTEYATFGLGCFWCGEAVFQRLDGVKAVVSGYEGGETENPTYKEVCSGESGHAEVIRIEFDPGKIAFSELLDVFWKVHDPTQLNRQGGDVGTQYRSVVFYNSDEQKQAAEAAKRQLGKSSEYRKPVVTEISESSGFYAAEADHQDYYNRNPNQAYCKFNIAPKLKKMGMSTDPQ